MPNSHPSENSKLAGKYMKQELRREMKARDINLGFINIGMAAEVLQMDEVTGR